MEKIRVLLVEDHVVVREGIRELIERDAQGNVTLVHEDALFSEEDVKWLNDFYLTDIRPNELEEFASEHVVVAASFIINDKEYLVVESIAD